MSGLTYVDIHQSYRFPFASYPAVRLVLLFAAGIIIDAQLDVRPLTWIALVGAAILVYGLCEYAYTTWLKNWAHRTALVFYLVALGCLGGMWHALFSTADVPTEAEVINSYRWEELTFKGDVHQIKKSSSGNIQLDVAVDTTFFPDSLIWEKPYRMRAIINPDELMMPENLRLGDRITFVATIYPLEPPTNPHEFDYKGYLASRNIYVQSGIKKMLNVKKERRFFSWNKIRRTVLKAIEQNFSDRTNSLAKALLIGYKNELNQETKQAFSRAGLSHIMAVSGLHVGFILAPFWIVVPFFWTFRHGKKVGLMLLIGLLLFYAGLTGFSASVTRASLTGGFLMYGRLFHKVRNSKNLTVVAALIILLINPSDLFSIGFQLSFGAVYIILLVAPVVSRTLPRWIRYSWYGKPLMAVVISLIVQVGLYPLLGYYFGEFSLIGPLANAVVVPFLGLAIPLALLLLIPAMFWPAAGAVLNLPIDYFFAGLDVFVTTAASLEWSWIHVHIENTFIFIIWMALVGLIAVLPIPRLRWKMIAVVLALLCWQQGQKLIQKVQPAHVELTIFDVGQGDATLISTPADKHYLVDTGRWQPGHTTATYTIIPYLKGENIQKLDGIFLSHPHADHIGGIVALLEQVPVDTVYNSGATYDSDLYGTYHQLADKKGIPVISLQAGQHLQLEQGLELFVYGPGEEASPSSNINNRSLIFELVYGSTEFLFMGDAEQPQEEQLIKTYPHLIDTDFLKIGHHGSKTSTTSDLLEAVNPEVGIVSLGLRNQFNHPHAEAVRRMRRDSIALYFTSLEGAIKVYSDGDKIRVDE